MENKYNQLFNTVSCRECGKLGISGSRTAGLCHNCAMKIKKVNTDNTKVNCPKCKWDGKMSDLVNLHITRKLKYHYCPECNYDIIQGWHKKLNNKIFKNKNMRKEGLDMVEDILGEE